MSDHTGEVTVDQIEQVLADHTWGGVDTMGRVTCHDSTGGWHVYEGPAVDHERHQAEAIALLYEAASRPRQVTTVAELDALPVGSVVLNDRGVAWQKRGANDRWYCSGLPSGIKAVPYLPARVLYNPEETR